MAANSKVICANSLVELKNIPQNFFRTCITSPPYWGLRDYDHPDQIGMESDMEDYFIRLIQTFDLVHGCLKSDGTLWVIIGDGYTSGNRKYRAPDKKSQSRGMNYRPDNPKYLKNKDLLGIPWRLAIRLQEKGWYLRSDLIWHKKNAMPESVKDRPYRNHEYIFLFSKSEKYYFDQNGLKVNQEKKRRSVWDVNVVNNKVAHPAMFPKDLILPCILSSTKKGDFILDPFFGVGTVGIACQEVQRNFYGIELNSKYAKTSIKRLGLTK